MNAAMQKYERMVASTLKDEARRGETTKKAVVARVMNKIDVGGGHEKFGIGAADVRVALHHIIGNCVERQFKAGLPDNLLRHALRNAPSELVQIMPKLPAWIATGEGRDARRVPSLQATPADWAANAELKGRKARQTQAQADWSSNIARFLTEYGMRSLSDAVHVEAAE